MQPDIDLAIYPEEELLRDHAFLVPYTSSVVSDGAASRPANAIQQQGRVVELEAEVERLREQLGKAKSINDTMWEKIVQRTVNGIKDTTMVS